MTGEPLDTALRGWEKLQPDTLTKDPLWTLNCYREALFLVDQAHRDVGTIAKRDPLAAAKGQLITSVGSIAANIAECYGRMTAPDRMRFLSYALGSAREAIAWYRTVNPTTREELDDRLTRLARTRRMLLGLMRRLDQGGRKFERW